MRTAYGATISKEVYIMLSRRSEIIMEDYAPEVTATSEEEHQYSDEFRTARRI